MISSCNKTNSIIEHPDNNISDQNITNTHIDSEIINTHLMVNAPLGSSRDDIKIPAEELFGRFYNERVEYFIIQNPEFYLSNALVKELTLYYVDKKLYKKKYLLDSDISIELIKSYGGFKFIPMNTYNDSISTNETILSKQNGTYRLNEKLTRYELMWHKVDFYIKYQFYQDSIHSEYELHEIHENYQPALFIAENNIDTNS